MADVARPSLPIVSLVAGGLCLVLTGLHVAEPLAFQRTAIAGGEWWRLWSAHLVHFSWSHALINITVLIVSGALAERELGSRAVVLFWLLGPPLLSLGLMQLAPQMSHYRGASGISMAFGFAVGTRLWHTGHRYRRWLVLAAVAMLSKITLDALALLPPSPGLPDGVAVAWQIHALGVLAGCSFTVICHQQRVKTIL